LPLALELAAARANVLTPAEILTQIDGRLPALTWRSPDRPERHQSLRTAIDWSYQLLSEPERIVFRRLAVLPEAWPSAAAAALRDLDEEAQEGTDHVGRLVDASLVQVVWGPDGPRFQLLETTREYAAEQLDSAGERAAAERARYAYFSSMAVPADSDETDDSYGAYARGA
jgi:predicted ATPase